MLPSEAAITEKKKVICFRIGNIMFKKYWSITIFKLVAINLNANWKSEPEQRSVPQA